MYKHPKQIQLNGFLISIIEIFCRTSCV